MKESIAELVKELKELKTGAKLSAFIFALISCIIDLFLLINGIHTPNIIRGIYYAIGFVSLILLINDFCKFNEQKTELKNKEENIINTIRKISGEEAKLLYKFVENDSLNIELTEKELDTALELRHILGGRIAIGDKNIFIHYKTLELIKKALDPDIV